MLNRLNLFRQQCLSGKRGQTSLILIIMAAIALAFLAISMNWGRVAAYKSNTMVSAHKGATMLASQLTSYAQQQSEESLKGKLKYCKSTSVFGAIFGFILVALLTWLCWGTCVMGAAAVIGKAAAVTLAIGAVVLSAAALVINVTVIQPGISELWNKLQMNLQIEDRLLESGLSTAMQEVVSDNGMLADFSDMDLDGLWDDPINGVSNSTDTISRYSYHYTRRLQSVMYAPIPEIQAFLEGIGTLMENDGWQFLPEEVSCEADSGRCNPCCAGPTVVFDERDDGSSTARIEESEECIGSSGQCAISSPFGATYPFAYDPLYGFSGSNSFLGMIGHDDDNANYTGTNPTDTGFSATDASGMFSTFWKLSDLEEERTITVTLNSSITQSLTLDNFQEPEDFIADDDQCADVACQGDSCLWKKGIDRFCSTEAPHDEACQRHTNAGCSTMTTEEFVTAWNAATSEGQRDRVQEDYEETLLCSCSNARQSSGSADDMPLWAEDSFDQLRSEVLAFTSALNVISSMPMRNLEMAFSSWYPEFEQWIGDGTNGSERGRLFAWVDTLSATRQKLINWQNEAIGSGDAFCSTSRFEDLDTTESTHISSVSAAQEQVIQCLDFHANRAVGIWQRCEDALNDKMDHEQCQTSCNNLALRTPERCEELYQNVVRLPDGIANQNLIECLDRNILTDQACQDNYDAEVADAEADKTTCLANVVTEAEVQQCLDDCDANHSDTYSEDCLDDDGAIDLPRSLDSNQDDPASMSDSTLLTYIENSKLLASRHTSDFSERKELVEDVYEEVEALSLILGRAIFEFEAFLNGPAAGLRDFSRRTQCTPAQTEGVCNQEDQDLSNFIIYGWKTYPDGERATDRGKWHVVRVEGIIPKRCGGSDYCGANDRMPWIKTKKKGFLGTKRCFYLKDYEGRVAVRTTRWDQTEGRSPVTLANGAELWSFRYNKPGTSTLTKDFSGCYALDRYLTPANGAEATKAFMINRFPTLKSFCHLREPNRVIAACQLAQQCWMDTEAVLRNGVKTTSCAEYFWNGERQDMSLRFIDCDNHHLPFEENKTFYTLRGEDIRDACSGDVQEICREVWDTDQDAERNGAGLPRNLADADAISTFHQLQIQRQQDNLISSELP